MKGQQKKRTILFVCLGNICRSPAAEAVMNSLVTVKKLSNFILCDSAGTAGYHIGELADARMREHTRKRGYSITHRARQFDAAVDFEKFDMIVTMDDSNYADIVAQDKKKAYTHKIFMMTTFCTQYKTSTVPDPYYDGPEAFENVLNILEDACNGLMTLLVNGK
mgnify:FL=1